MPSFSSCSIRHRVLIRNNRVTASSLEDALVVGPREELTLLQNRDKFDLVVVYDQSSKSLDQHLAGESSTIPSSNPLNILVKAIWNDSRAPSSPYVKTLKKAPVLLVGGMDAWKKEIGDIGIARWSESMDSNSGQSRAMGQAVASISSQYPSPTTSSASASVLPSSDGDNAYQLWTPRPRSSTTSTASTLRDIAPTRFFADSGTIPPRLVLSSIILGDLIYVSFEHYLGPKFPEPIAAQTET